VNVATAQRCGQSPAGSAGVVPAGASPQAQEPGTGAHPGSLAPLWGHRLWLKRTITFFV
jgi:hypothetical protein